ncbi:MAG: hypothetical protein MH204_09595, partial [Fimbriimonadaceae bacterium]|nr:hypothetical protein [Fimbriimonadaceae bacterium]
PAVTPSRITVSVEIVVDGRRWNARQVVFENRAPWTQIRAGQSIKILVVSNGASVEVPGKVRRVDQRTGEITVESSTKAILTGWLNAAGQVEVKA